jgi:hypothetical protein
MIVNITNPQAIGDWLQKMSAGDDDIARWLQKAFTKALKKREKSAVPLREWPENPPAWMKPDGSYHEFRPDPELTQKVSHIIDWLAAARRQDPACITNLYPMDLASAFNQAEKYFTKVNQRNQAIIEDDADTKTVMRFDNGIRIVQLMTPEALKYEGAKMGHCIGGDDYEEALVNGSEVFYSLRDARNRPHVTMEVDVADNALIQCRGKKNEPPVEKYMPMLQEFLTQQQFALQESPAYCGLVLDTDGQYYSINSLPENLSIKGNLDLADSPILIQLPENLSVGGNFDLAGNKALTRLPENLSVKGDFRLEYCSSLEQLPVNLSVGGSLSLNDCKALTQLPENFSVGGTLSLAYCTSLTQLPENFTVGGHFNIVGTSLTHLPENLTVNGDLYLNACHNITSIPNSLKCTGKIWTSMGTFATVAEAADAFDAKFRPRQPYTRPSSTGLNKGPIFSYQ